MPICVCAQILVFTFCYTLAARFAIQAVDAIRVLMKRMAVRKGNDGDVYKRQDAAEATDAPEATDAVEATDAPEAADDAATEPADAPAAE